MTDEEKKKAEEKKNINYRRGVSEFDNPNFANQLFEEMVEDMGMDYLEECSEEELAELISERTGERASEDVVDDFLDYIRNQTTDLYASKENETKGKEEIKSSSEGSTVGALHYIQDPAGGLYVFDDNWKMSLVAKIDAQKWISEHPDAIEVKPENELQTPNTSIMDDDLLQP